MSDLPDAIRAATAQPTVEMPALDDGADNGAGAADSSVLSAVRLRAAQLAHENTVELDIPGYDGVLVGRYKAISIARVYNGPNNTLRNPLTEWGVAADALALALVGLYGRNEHGELEPLFSDQDARFDDDLAAALHLEPTARTARAVLVALCGGDALGESRVWSHFMQYQNWLMEGTASEVAADAVGEQSAQS